MMFDPSKITTTAARHRVRSVRNVCGFSALFILLALVSSRLGLGYYHGWMEALFAGWAAWSLFALLGMTALLALAVYAARALYFVRYPGQWKRKLERIAARRGDGEPAAVEVDILPGPPPRLPVEDVQPIPRQPVRRHTRPVGEPERPPGVGRTIRGGGGQ